jgi:quinol-cytochrome oxidoreductase complex cytochrome b subunit
LTVRRGLAVDFASTKNISMWWNFRSLSRLWIAMQVFTGLVISSTLVASIIDAFNSVEMVMENGVGRHILRFIHANFCSIVFMILIVHVGKRLWFGSGVKSNLWKIRTLLLVLTMGASFLGYVLPWGHMSFWGATVITSLLTVAPYGNDIVVMVWGGFSLGGACLGRFFTLHFLLPLLVLAVITVHLHLLHEYVSSSPVGNGMGVSFTNWYVKDGVTLFLTLIRTLIILIVSPIMFIDADNWFHCNPMVTPAHIKPEWYFLPFYCILRCVPDKTLRVLTIVRSLLLIGLIRVIGIGFINARVLLLTIWLGGAALEPWYIMGSQIVTVVYIMSIK